MLKMKGSLVTKVLWQLTRHALMAGVILAFWNTATVKVPVTWIAPLSSSWIAVPFNNEGTVSALMLVVMSRISIGRLKDAVLGSPVDSGSVMPQSSGLENIMAAVPAIFILLCQCQA